MQSLQQNEPRGDAHRTYSRCALPAALYERCEPFFSRFSLSGLDWGDVVLGLSELDPASQGIDWSDWYRGFVSLAERYAEQGESAVAAEHHVTAGQRLIKACASAHFAEFMDFEHPALKQQARDLATRLFRRALPYLPNTVEIVELDPVSSCSSIILMRRPNRQSTAQPCIILVNGLDSINEVELYGFANAFVERGLSVLMFEGPGQGRLCGSKQLPVDFETVMADVLTQVRHQPAVDSQRLGVFGVSFGGYLAARCAALFPKQLRACINLSGGYDYDHFTSMPALVRRNFQFVFGRDEAEITTLAQRHLNLRGVPRLKVPLLSIHGEGDVVVPIETARRLMDWADGDKELISYSNERHVCTNSFPDCIPRMADWMAERLCR